jgi:hypothetical protein
VSSQLVEFSFQFEIELLRKISGHGDARPAHPAAAVKGMLTAAHKLSRSPLRVRFDQVNASFIGVVLYLRGDSPYRRPARQA